jgi:hypothetical protein
MNQKQRVFFPQDIMVLEVELQDQDHIPDLHIAVEEEVHISELIQIQHCVNSIISPNPTFKLSHLKTPSFSPHKNQFSSPIFTPCLYSISLLYSIKLSYSRWN